MGGTRKGVGAYLSLSLRGRELGCGWALIKFFCLQDGRLFEMGANARLGAYSNKYGISIQRVRAVPYFLQIAGIIYVCFVYFAGIAQVWIDRHRQNVFYTVML